MNTPWTLATAPIRVMVSGYCKSDKDLKAIVFLQAAIDDSSTDWGEKRLHLAGYAMSAPNWETFSEEWKTILDEPPAVPYFKMSESRGDDNQRKKIRPLAELIAKFRPMSIRYSLSRNDFQDAFSSSLLRKYIFSPYFPAYFGLIPALVTRWALAGQRSGRKMPPVEFIFIRRAKLSKLTRFCGIASSKLPPIPRSPN
jgi:hypothetical protein